MQRYSANRKKSFSSTYSSDFEHTFYIFSYSFELLEVFCQQFHWNIYSNYFQNVYWRMLPETENATMQFVWNQDFKLVIYFRILTESKIGRPGIRQKLGLSDDDRLYFIELAGDELQKSFRDTLQKEGCRTSYFDVIYKRLMVDYQEVMKLELEQELFPILFFQTRILNLTPAYLKSDLDIGDKNGSVRDGSLQRASIDQRSKLGTERGGSKRGGSIAVGSRSASIKPGSIAGGGGGTSRRQSNLR
ncbi:uncharacterized protein LOC142344342 [Convolutriloba macropyga]|uniref:uncharacterized protein LOC142344342 n=1 Tax=Convolutriloba macropyga TaxID=536237 RepID=UPI003F523B87